MLQTFDIDNWQESIVQENTQEALTALESGKVIFLPQLSFNLLSQELPFLSTHHASPKTKNISFDHETGALQGAICTRAEHSKLSLMMKRYAEYSKNLVDNLFPHYRGNVKQGRTSFRPVEISGRKAPSFRKDDTRLHVDAFPSTPMQGKRILRVFTNVNPDNKPRIWRLGAPFQQVVEHFLPRLKKPFFGSSFFLNLLKITKNPRTQYDHYMLQLHDAMKSDMAYQEAVSQITFEFPANSSWIVYTDQVSHAAMSGQFTFEQTFYLPPNALAHIEKSPCKILEKFFQKELI